MALMRPFTSLQQDMNRLFNEMEREFFSPWSASRSGWREPMGGQELENVCPTPVDVIEEENEVRVKALVAGLKPEDIDVEVENDVLILSGQTREESETGTYYRCELPHGKLYRRIQLPTSVQSDKAKAHFENGILTVTLPKSEEVRRHRLKISQR